MGRTKKKLEVDFFKMSQSNHAHGDGEDKIRGFSKKSRRTKHHRHREVNKNLSSEVEYTKYNEFKREFPTRNPNGYSGNLFHNLGDRNNWNKEDQSLLDQLNTMRDSDGNALSRGLDEHIPVGIKRVQRRGNLAKFTGWDRSHKEMTME
jgi:hypothetical protein